MVEPDESGDRGDRERSLYRRGGEKVRCIPVME